MRVLNFGSLNRDLVYSVAHAVRPGETLASSKLETFCGGKGLNQSLALARAGAQVWHAGCVGADGGMVGNRTKVKVVKNKVAPPFKEAEFDIIYGEGISKEGNILDIAVSMDIVQKSGSWFSYNGERLGQGREAVKNILKENEELCAEIEAKVREAADLPAVKDLGEVEATPMSPVAKPVKPKKAKE